MAINWYFGRDDLKQGPFSARQMQGLAANGELRPTDTVWKEGLERGVVATRVGHLFADLPAVAADTPGTVPMLIPAAPASPPPAAARESLPPPDSLPDDAEMSPLEGASAAEAPAAASPASDAHTEEKEAPVKKPPPRQEVRKRRVVSIKGGILVGQDGVNLRFRKTCVKCNHPDTSVATTQIPLGNTRINFFCPRCRKNQPVEIQGAS
jgi:hypothetical protein